MGKEELLILIRKYMDSTATDAERDALFAYYDGFENLPDFFNGKNTFAAHKQERKLLAQLQTAIVSAQGVLPRNRLSWPSILKIAASVLLFLGSALTFYLLKTPSIGTKLVYKQIEAKLGQRLQVSLSDGSTIWLNAGSRLSYPVNFGEKKRALFLVGEAFFKVAENRKKPFTVVAGDIMTTDLGTSFDVKAYPGSQAVRVSLASGSVEVVRRNQHLSTLVPGQQLTYRPNGIFTVASIPFNTFAGWVNDQIAYQNAPLTEIFEDLERKFDVSIKADVVETYGARFVGDFNRLPFKAIMQLLSVSAHFSYKISGRTVSIRFHHRSQSVKTL